jgi:hypothetical protein
MAVNQKVRNKLQHNTKVFEDHAFDNSIIGTTFDGRAVYDYDKMVKELMEDEHWSEEDATEWIEYNTLRALPYMGKDAPVVAYIDSF